jgi:hypothetical protein
VRGRWISLDIPVYSTNTDRQNITEILLKVALSTIKQKHNIKVCPHVDVPPNIVDGKKIKLLAFSICTCLWAFAFNI